MTRTRAKIESMTLNKNSTTHFACDEQLSKLGGKTPCCGFSGHECYNPKSHSKKDCREHHPVLLKEPAGFQGFHDEDYKDL